MGLRTIPFGASLGPTSNCGFTKPHDVDALRIRLRVADRIVQLTERVRTLEGILPMCAYCRRIRDEGGVYQSLEDFVSV